MGFPVCYADIRNHLLACIERVGTLSTEIAQLGCRPAIINLGSLYSELFIVADILRINVVVAIQTKIRLNEKKYPIKYCRGSVQKYSAYSGKTSITKTSGQTIVDSIDVNRLLKEPQNNTDEFRNEIEALTTSALKFTSDRGFEPYDTPRNLFFALHTELAELCEIFQWKGDDTVSKSITAKDWDSAAKEIADVFIFSFKLYNALSNVTHT
jgi:NTP pyrophosphatase (non-canonical NTP hydrolase)